MGVRELLKAIGSQQKIALQLEVAESLPAHWARRGMIPIRYWKDLLKMADKAGKDISLQTIYQACIDDLRRNGSL